MSKCCKVNIRSSNSSTPVVSDSFTATFVGLTVQGVDFREAHKTAVDVAAYVCTQEGAMPVLSAELLERIKQLKAKAAV